MKSYQQFWGNNAICDIKKIQGKTWFASILEKAPWLKIASLKSGLSKWMPFFNFDKVSLRRILDLNSIHFVREILAKSADFPCILAQFWLSDTRNKAETFKFMSVSLRFSSLESFDNLEIDFVSSFGLFFAWSKDTLWLIKAFQNSENEEQASKDQRWPSEGKKFIVQLSILTLLSFNLELALIFDFRTSIGAWPFCEKRRNSATSSSF